MSNLAPKTIYLLDAYARGDRMMVWFVDEDGRPGWTWDRFMPTWFFRARTCEIEDRLCSLLQRLGLQCTPAERNELYEGPIRVIACQCPSPVPFSASVRMAQTFHEDVELYNADLPIAHLYFYHRQWFAGARLSATIDPRTHELLNATLRDDPWKTIYEPPPVTILHLHCEGGSNDARHPHPRSLIARINHEERIFEGSELEQIESLEALLRQHDPDLLLTQQGDDFLLPHLTALAQRHRRPLTLNRDPTFQPLKRTSDRSYFSYGKIIFKPGDFRLYGRLHLDARNSFLLGEGDLPAIWELCRITHAPLQQASRATIGTGLSSMQFFQAIHDQILIPSHKHVPEAWKDVLTLFQTDKGGLVYQPRPGFYERVAQLDFSSMYPRVMVNHNISPETVNCVCCPSAPPLPESGMRLCQKREGLIPRTLRPLVEKRQRYKELLKRSPDPSTRRIFDQRQNCHKWLLVTCFGYLGYKNARFGRIEAHEAVTTLGREMLLRAKEVAEGQGFRFYHAIVDCLWVKRPKADLQTYERLAADIGRATGIPMAVDGIYRWLIFCSSRGQPGASVANRYVGAFEHGEVKIRGLEQRRHDTPLFIRRLQERVIQQLSEATNRETFARLLPDILEETDRVLQDLHDGRINFDQLLISKNISRHPLDYRVSSQTATATRQLLSAGIELQPGQRVSYLLTDTASPNPDHRVKAFQIYDLNDGIDFKRYTELTLRSIETLFAPLGYNAKTLRALLPSCYD